MCNHASRTYCCHGESSSAWNILRHSCCVVFQVSTEQFHFWLSGLREISQAEQRVLSGHVSGHVCTVQLLSQAIVHYQKASAALKVDSLIIFERSL